MCLGEAELREGVWGRQQDCVEDFIVWEGRGHWGSMEAIRALANNAEEEDD